MIATITLNASIDKRYLVNDLVKGTIMRAARVDNTAGGKGLNVSRVIRMLGEEVVATGFLGGKNGEFIAKKISSIGIKDQFVRISDDTRCCLAIISNDLVQTEILEPGPIIDEAEIDSFFKTYVDILKKCKIICASGSLPRNVPATLYKQLIEKANAQKVRFLLDASGEALKNGMQAMPFFIKPNLEELTKLVGKKLHGETDIITCIHRLQDYGTSCVVVSLGANGAIAGLEGRIYRVVTPRVQAVNPVGSGDSLVAGFAVGLQRGYLAEQLLAFSCACGTANAMEGATGCINPEKVYKLVNEIDVKKIN